MSATPHDLATLLKRTIESELPELRAITEEQASAKPARPGAWSKKEELGHLIDSATNNHVRFVRMALEDNFQGLSYAQDDWVSLHAYHDIAWSSLVDIWEKYNSLLSHLAGHISAGRLDSRGVIGTGEPVTLRFLIEDYVLHMQHHLDHVLSRGNLTLYPRPQAQ
ncbi:MAG TPA: DinB family protein [Bryobacteraceae bacterium]|nr:DinB family protein [Bryobacteraceae bacterium]